MCMSYERAEAGCTAEGFFTGKTGKQIWGHVSKHHLLETMPRATVIITEVYFQVKTPVLL